MQASTTAPHRNTTRPRRGLVLVGERGPRYEADVVLTNSWVHLTNARERFGAMNAIYHRPSVDRTLRARDVREIRWVDSPQPEMVAEW